MTLPQKIDLHIHTVVSDGTDTPAELLARVREVGITLFSVTDHDAVKGCEMVKSILRQGDPAFIPGVEFSCEDEEGRYHILGYGYRLTAPAVLTLVNNCHSFRIEKVHQRLAFIKEAFGFTFSEEDVQALFLLNNPGKPHIGNLMVKYGYAPTLAEAIRDYLNRFKGEERHIRPEEAIDAIIQGGGIPILAHPSYGRGDELVVHEDMDKRLRKLMGYGLKGVEAFYSAFTPTLQRELLSFADKYDLYVTAGSDYHGSNKLVQLGDTNLEGTDYPRGLRRFLEAVL